MHFFSRRHASVALGLVAMGALAACGDDVTVPVQVAPVAIAISPQAVSLNPGASATLSVQITGGSPTPTLASCSSGAATVATAAVSGGNCTVTAVNPGSTTITATTSSGQSASAAVTVNALPAALGELTVSPATANLSAGQTVQLVPNPRAAGTGVTVAYTYTSSNSAIASVNASGLVTAGTSTGVATITISATGTGTGFAAATRTAAATITVASAPQSITTLTATPQTLALATGGSAQVAATVSQPTGAPAASITFGSTNGSVATVTAGANNTATITGVSAGTATITVTASAPAATGFAASTLTQLISVSVSPAAQVAIGNITSGLTNNPVDITDVRNQIQVALNITTNGQNVQKAQVWVCEPSDDVPTCAARTNGVPAAEQTFGAAGANDGSLNAFINTAEFTVDANFANASVRHTNGQKVLVATLVVPGQAAVASPNRAILNFNNTDGFAASHTAPSRSAVNATTNTTMFGGPDAAGRGSVTVVPVMYTAGRSIARVTAGITGACSGTITFVTGTDARPWSYTYGYSLGTSAGANARNIVCAAESNPALDPDVAPRVTASIDNAQNAGPVVATAAGFRTSTSNTPAVNTPATIRVDYVGPTVTQPDLRRNAPAVTGWVNNAFSFATNTAASSDAGAGLKANSRVFQYNGCGTGSTTWVTMADGTGASIPECGSDLTGGWDASATPAPTTRGPFRVRIQELDLLDNQGTSANSGNFGVDKVAPQIRWSTASAADTTLRTATSSAAQFQAEFIDERAGFIEVTDVGTTGALRPDGSTLPTTSGSQQHFATRAAGLLLNTAAAAKAVCINPITGATLTGSTNAPGAAFQTNPTCGFTTAAYTTMGTLGDGYRSGAGAPLASQAGIYHYATRVFDRAGNESSILRRRLAADFAGDEPTIADLAVPATVSATASPILTYNAQDNVEIRALTIGTSFTATGWLAYPQQITDARFNDNINSPLGGATTTLGLTNPTLLGVSTALGTAPTPLQTAALLAWDVANRTNTTSATGGYLSQGVPALTAVPNASAFSGWSMLTSRAAAFNSPEGIKAQLVSSTNVTNAPFARVEFYRFASTATGSALPLSGARWEYLGAATAAASADQGTTRFFTWALSDADYANRPNAAETRQSPGANGDNIVAIGILANGSGFITDPTFTLGGPLPSRIALTIAGLPAGASGSVTISDGSGFSQTVTASGTINLPAAGTYFVTAASTSFNSQNFVPNAGSVSQTVVVGANALQAVTVTYIAAVTRIDVTVSGLVDGGVGEFTVTGPGGFTTTRTGVANGSTVQVLVPAAGAYTVAQSGSLTIGLNTYTATATGAVTVSVGTPSTAAVTYSNTTTRATVNVNGPAGLTADVSVTCGALAPAAAPLGSTTFRPSAGNEACVIAANPVLFGGQVYLPSGTGTVTATTAATIPSLTVTYTLTTPSITINSLTVGGGSNNLPNGIAYTVRVSGSAFAAEGGFRDFAAVTGTPLVIDQLSAGVPLPAGTYNVSLLNQLTLNTQTWTVAAVGDVTATGGLVAATPALTAPNVVVQNIQVGPATPASATTAANLAMVINIEWTGPTP